MKKVLIVLAITSILMGSSVLANTAYTNNDRLNNGEYTYNSEQADQNRAMWTQTISSYENNYNDSMKKYWDEYTAAYQRQKKIQH